MCVLLEHTRGQILHFPPIFHCVSLSRFLTERVVLFFPRSRKFCGGRFRRRFISSQKWTQDEAVLKYYDLRGALRLPRERTNGWNQPSYLCKTSVSARTSMIHSASVKKNKVVRGQGIWVCLPCHRTLCTTFPMTCTKENHDYDLHPIYHHTYQPTHQPAWPAH